MLKGKSLTDFSNLSSLNKIKNYDVVTLNYYLFVFFFFNEINIRMVDTVINWEINIYTQLDNGCSLVYDWNLQKRNNELNTKN